MLNNELSYFSPWAVENNILKHTMYVNIILIT
jgi:hypothetical protein